MSTYQISGVEQEVTVLGVDTDEDGTQTALLYREHPWQKFVVAHDFKVDGDKCHWTSGHYFKDLRDAIGKWFAYGEVARGNFIAAI